MALRCESLRVVPVPTAKVARMESAAVSESRPYQPSSHEPKTDESKPKACKVYQTGGTDQLIQANQ